MTRFLMTLVLPICALSLAVHHLPEAYAQSPAETEELEGDVSATEDDIFEDGSSNAAPTADETEEMAKEIAEEPDAPPAEFPYPGATEEGFEPTKPAVQLEAREAPAGLIRPVRINSSGEYFYGFKSSSRSASASVRLGFFGPPDIVNEENDVAFEQIYGNQDIPALFGDYQWSLTKRFGDLGLKVGSGLFVSQGNGEFVQENPERTNRTPDETFTFLMLPNTLTAIYRFQYAETQPIVPYIEGGAGYFTFAELRDDGAGPKIGGAPVAIAAGGLNFLMDWLDPHSVRQLDNEWGINHVWLLTEYRLITGLNKEYDFSSSVINAGVLMEF
ncbi:MAG: hypothetical protein NDI61_00920 [Bdellovibrionaceae bacterium]|nr:hypothetical protein [Pseudobdellovibrionaceae bacterium]